MKKLTYALILLLVLSTLALPQGQWKPGGTFGFDQPAEDLSFATDSRGVIHAVARNGTELRHYMRGSKNPFPWETEGRVIPGSFVGSGHIEIWKDGNLMIAWPRSDGLNDTWWENPLAFPDPSYTPPAEKILSVSNGKLYYGEDEIRLSGVSQREAFWRSTGEYNPFGGWQDYSLEMYEVDIEESGINYVRHMGVQDTQFMVDFCTRMKAIDVIVEVEVYDAYDGSYGVLVDINEMWKLDDIGNVIFDCGNEFLNYEPAIGIVIGLAEQLVEMGCLVSAGAWSGPEGQGYSEIFHDLYFGHQIETHHRHWVVPHWESTIAYGKPVLFNEFFTFGAHDKDLEDCKAIMLQAFDTGCTGVQFYNFWWPGIEAETPAPFYYRDMMDFAGSLK